MATDELRATKAGGWKVAAGADSEGARRTRLAGDIRGDSKSAAKAVVPGALENVVMVPLEVDQAVELTPVESDIGSAASDVNGILSRTTQLKQFLDPMLGIIVETNQPSGAAGYACMVEQCEEVKAELERGVREQRAKLPWIAAQLGSFREAVAKPPPPSCAASVARGDPQSASLATERD